MINVSFNIGFILPSDFFLLNLLTENERFLILGVKVASKVRR